MTETDAIIVVALARSNMNLCEAARRSNYHINSIAYRIRKIRHVIGLDPKNFFDLGELYTMAVEILGDKADDV